VDSLTKHKLISPNFLISEKDEQLLLIQRALNTASLGDFEIGIKSLNEVVAKESPY
jgi:hypothetical protein